jgi:hypothetical protein
LALSSLSTTSDYELSAQETHHEIEGFFPTTFKRIDTSPDRGIGASAPVVPSFPSWPSGKLFEPAWLARFMILTPEFITPFQLSTCCSFPSTKQLSCHAVSAC